MHLPDTDERPATDFDKCSLIKVCARNQSTMSNEDTYEYLYKNLVSHEDTYENPYEDLVSYEDPYEDLTKIRSTTKIL